MEGKSEPGRITDTGVRRRARTRDVVAITVWGFAITKLFIVDIDVMILKAIDPSLMWMSTFRLLVFLVVVSTMWITLGTRQFGLTVQYACAFPAIVVFWKIPRALRSRWPYLIVFSPVIWGVLRKSKSLFVLYTMLWVSVAMVIMSSNARLLAFAATLIASYQIVELGRAVRSTYTLNPMDSLIRFAKDARARIAAGTFFLEEKQGHAEGAEIPKANPYAADPIEQLYLWHGIAELVSERVQVIVKRGVYDLYLVIAWLLKVVMTIVAFAFVYMALYKIDHSSFAPHGEIGVSDFLRYSLDALSTSSHSGLEAASDLVRTISGVETFYGFVLLVVTAFAYFASGRDSFQERIGEFATELHLSAEALEGLARSVHQVTVHEIEKTLLSRGSIFVSILRSARGLPDLKLDAETELSKDGERDKPAPNR